jgi:hypothetical protein
MPRHKKKRAAERKAAPPPVAERRWLWDHVGLGVILGAIVVIDRPELQSAHGRMDEAITHYKAAIRRRIHGELAQAASN